jgi:uncharacterized membrane-anchored protein
MHKTSHTFANEYLTPNHLLFLDRDKYTVYVFQQVVGTTGTTLQRNITIYVLVAGIAGGLLLTLAILLLCKYCSRLRSRTNSERNTANPVVR